MYVYAYVNVYLYMCMHMYMYICMYMFMPVFFMFVGVSMKSRMKVLRYKACSSDAEALHESQNQGRSTERPQ